MKWTVGIMSFLVLALAGCMTTGYTPPAPSPLASAESDAEAKQFSPAQGKGNLYIQRNDEITLIGQPAAFAVTVDGIQVGGILPGMYYCFVLEPGRHTLSASSEVSIAHATVTVEAGKNYYYQILKSKAPDNTEKLDLSWIFIEPMGKLLINQSKRGQAAVD